jgi:hypothetical protein
MQRLATLSDKLDRFVHKSPPDRWIAIRETIKEPWRSASRWVANTPRRVWETLNQRHRRRRIFREIYDKNLWGSDGHSKFYSGVGSRGESAEIYVKGMARVLESHVAELGRKLTVVDLGCGDFEIGHALVTGLPDLIYVGCDIVPEVVIHNTKTYANERISFRQLDIVADPLPNADVCLVRQVLQHLSNAEIIKFLQRANYKYLYITEGHPSVRTGPVNPAKATGGDVRFDWHAGRGRGVELDKPPYCMLTEEMFRACERPNEVIITERVLSAPPNSSPVNRKPFSAGAARPNRIPPCIFQTWKSKVDIPKHFAQWMSSFDLLNPDFQHVLWDDDDNRNFIASYYNWFLPIYDSYAREIYRADAIRYFFLYTFGGIYADMDAECLKPLGHLLDRGDVLVGRMGDASHPHSIPNATMASKPRQEFWLLVIWLLVIAATETRWLDPEEVTGPTVLKSAVDLYLSQGSLGTRSSVRSAIRDIARLVPSDLHPIPTVSNVQILPRHEWFPIDHTDPIHLRLCQDIAKHGSLSDELKRQFLSHSSIVSYWAHSW